MQRLSGSIDKRHQSRITRDPSMNVWLPIYPSLNSRHSPTVKASWMFVRTHKDSVNGVKYQEVFLAHVIEDISSVAMSVMTPCFPSPTTKHH